jgi:hypothetical protein
LDHRFLVHLCPKRWKQFFTPDAPAETEAIATASAPGASGKLPAEQLEADGIGRQPQSRIRKQWKKLKLSLTALVLSWIFYATTVELIWMFVAIPLPTEPLTALEPFRIANRYGLFGIMTRGRYEIEFQGSADGKTWVAYPFRYKPQDVNRPPGIYAPYQPRFDWNLWFASLGSWRDYPIVTNTEIRLLTNDRDVLALFEKNPFPREAPREVRAVLWQYWFTTTSLKRTQGLWWRREYLGLYAPTIERESDGSNRAVEYPTVGPHD